MASVSVCCGPTVRAPCSLRPVYRAQAYQARKEGHTTGHTTGAVRARSRALKATGRGMAPSTPAAAAKATGTGRGTLVVAAAAAAATGAFEQPRKKGLLGEVVDSVQTQFNKLDGLWNRFIPMSLLFFLMAFVNTIIDSLKDSLVITAVGGGTEVIPYLTVYAVLPSSVLFLVAYSWGTQRFSREKLFNIILCIFLAFYGAFALVYPHHDALHLNALAEQLVAVVPSGLSGLVGMMRNWLFTLFYCMSELWGDVMLSLLFWGLANETTSIEDAPLLYPLFGIGANIAQTVAGRVLRLFSDAAAGSHMSYTQQLQCIMFLCLGLGGAILLLHAWISCTFPKNPKGSTALKQLQAAKQAALTGQQDVGTGDTAANSSKSSHHLALDLEAAVQGLNYCSLDTQHVPPSSNGAALPSQHASANAAAVAAAGNVGQRSDGYSASLGSRTSKEAARDRSSSEAAAEQQRQVRQAKKRKQQAMGIRDAWQFLRKSPQIRCLAVMALAQGITTNLLDLAWKHYLHKMATTPAAYSAFLGDTAMWTGIVTGTLMFASPFLFDRVGWRGVASATPNFMLIAGLPFFACCIVFTFMAGSMAAGPANTMLFGLVITGAILQVFSRGAKFSLFKPAEEMVYIGLDDESRTKGKAAIDVVGAQSGKSIGSILQQALLILSGGTLGGILPILAVFYAGMLRNWTRAVDDLAAYDPSHVHRMSVAGSIDDEDGPVKPLTAPDFTDDSDSMSATSQQLPSPA